MNKKIILAFILTGIVALIVFVLKSQGLSIAQEHTWSLYTDQVRGFSIKYPSDILTPDGHTSPTAVIFNMIESSLYSARPIYIWVYPTTATDISKWMDEQNQGKSPSILRTNAYPTTIIDGEKAIVIENNDFSFIHNGKVWDILFDKNLLSQDDIELMRQSFRFI